MTNSTWWFYEALRLWNVFWDKYLRGVREQEKQSHYTFFGSLQCHPRTHRWVWINQNSALKLITKSAECGHGFFFVIFFLQLEIPVREQPRGSVHVRTDTLYMQ